MVITDKQFLQIQLLTIAHKHCPRFYKILEKSYGTEISQALSSDGCNVLGGGSLNQELSSSMKYFLARYH